MTGYESKKAAARDKLDDDDTQVYKDHGDALTIAYQSGYYDGKKAAQPAQEPVAHCEAGPEYCVQCKLEDRSIVLAAAVRYVKNNTPQLVSDEICMALATPPQRTEQCNYPDCKCPTENPCLKGLAQPAQEPVATLFGTLPVYDTAPPQRPWVGLMRGARVEGDTVVIKVQSNNEARLLCSELVNEMGKNT